MDCLAQRAAQPYRERQRADLPSPGPARSRSRYGL